jgi:putative Mg2+ transporter-C (MgtC) family protein
VQARSWHGARSSGALRRRQVSGPSRPSVLQSGGLYFAAAVSTTVIILILAGIKPIEEAYRARNQSCRLKIEAANGALTPELLKQALAIRTGQIKRFLVSPNASGEQVNVLLTKVSSHDIQSFVEKLNELDGVNAVSIIERKRGDQL